MMHLFIASLIASILFATSSIANPSPKPQSPIPAGVPLPPRYKGAQYCQSGRWDFKSAQDTIPYVKTGAGPIDVDYETGTMNLVLRPETLKDDKELPPGRYGVASTMAIAGNSMLYGTVTARMRASAHPGIVSTFILIMPLTLDGRDGRDEIDLEWLGGQPNSVSTNVYAKGHVAYAVNGQTIPVNNIADWHEYKIEWTPEYIKWSVDGQVLRTRHITESWTPVDHAGKPVNAIIFPTEPLQAQFGVWDSLRTNTKGTIDWAGGPTNWNNITETKVEIDWIEINCATENPDPTVVEPGKQSEDENEVVEIIEEYDLDSNGEEYVVRTYLANQKVSGGRRKAFALNSMALFILAAMIVVF